MDYNKIVLFSDLDGTLFDSSTAVPEINRQAIQHFTQQGGIFCVSTGRTQHNAAPYLEKVAVNGPCILYNGAAAYSFASRRFLFARTAPEEALEEYIRQILQDYPAVNIQVYTPEEICFVSPQELADAEFVRLHQPCVFSSLERAPRPWLKLLLQGTPDQLRTVQQMAPASVRENGDMVFSSPIYLELLPKAGRIARGTRSIVFQNIAGSLAVKLAVMVLGVAVQGFPLIAAVAADVGVMLIAVLNSMRTKLIK